MTQPLAQCLQVITWLVLLCAGEAYAGEAGHGSASKVPAHAGEIAVTKSDERSLVFEYRPRFSTPREIQQNGQKYMLYDFAGSVSSEMRKHAGFPDLRFRSFPIALPGEKGSTVRVIAADYEDILSVMYAPVPTMRMRDKMMETGSYSVNSAAYGAAGFLPAGIVDLTPTTSSRSLLLGGVRIYPLQYNAATRTVRKYTRIVVEISYGPRMTRPMANKDEVPFTNVMLNHNMAASWKVAPASAQIKSSVLASGAWYRLTVNEDGIYRLTAQYLTNSGINLAGINPQTIKIYGNGGTEIPEDVSAPRAGDLVENAIYVEGESDGKFDSGDFVVFYGRSPRGWAYDAPSKTLQHYINHYTEANYYWLTFGGASGKRMQAQPSLASSGAYAPDKFTDAVATEKEAENLVQSGKDWYGQRIEPNSSFTLVNTLPGLVPNDVIKYRYSLVAASSKTPVFTVKEREGNRILGIYTLGTISEDLAATAGTWAASGSSTLSNNSSQLNFAYQSSDPGAKSWIDWVEINYPRLLWAVDNVLHFRAPDTNAVVEYRLQQFTETPWVFNVSSFADVKLIAGVTGSYMFQASESARQPSEYWASTPATWKAPAAIDAEANQDLRGFSAGAQFIIVTSPEFRSPADRLAALRQSQGISTVVVNVDQIYNEFAGGLPDITGIRDYLRYAYVNWTEHPRYVLFFGQASYDYKGILGSKSSYVPTWQSVESRDDIYSYSTDDFFAKFGSGDGISLVLGRIPSRTVADATTVVDKAIRYDGSSVRDNWKLRIAYVGDDSWTPEREDGTIHSDAAEALAEQHTPDIFEKKKIYIAEYPTEYSAQGRRKPGAFQAIIDNINQGVLLLNFSGHGNPEQLAHENIFNVSTSIPPLVNSDRLTVFFMATCNFSQFDDPVRTSGGELLMNKQDGGAIAVMSATRKVYASENTQLANGTYDAMFGYNAYGQVVAMRPAEALFTFKVGSSGNGVNDQKFFFMGDPTMKLQFPSGYASIDSINQQPLDTLHGAPVSPVLIHALSRVTVSGSVRKEGNAIDDSFIGKLTLIVNDPTHKKVILNFWDSVDWPYMATGSTIFRGDNSIVNGRFHASFIVPRDVSFADSTMRGRMLVYFSNNAIDGAGITDQFRVGTPDSVATSDQLGPKISIYLDSRSFRPGDMVSEKPNLIVDLTDSSGINTSSSGIGHRIEAWINNGTQSTDVTDAYSNKLDNYTEGSVQYRLSNLPQGRNTLRVRAWDSFNNSASAETYFDVASGDQLTVTDVMNYPNPFANTTEFTFRQNQSGLINVTVKVYTVAGRLIQSLTTTSAGESFVRVPWDGRDRDGDLPANGVYFYKLLVSTADGRFSSEALGKLSIVK
jgi:hypothetical protein